ncbi:MAG: PIN domain-containing protein [Acidobacteria bacterium]|nr:PIN domain-containing protein [Acidobacteriota bacterium]
MALILDTGVVYAALDRGDRAHKRCRSLLERTTESLVLPSPILPEVDYWVSKHLGPGPMVALLRDIEESAYVVEDLSPEDYRRAAEVMDRYSDQDVGFVDSSILAVVERLREPKLATLDRRHFSVLRPRHVEALDLLP